jgi:hypothetical protein
LTGLFIEQALQERLEGTRHCVWVSDGFIDDQLDQGVEVVGVERRLSYEQFIKDHA